MKYKDISTPHTVARNGGSGIGRSFVILVLFSIIAGALVVVMTQFCGGVFCYFDL